MANFINCWNQLKAKGYKHANGEEVLSDKDKASIQSLIQDHVKSGASELDAAKRAVQSHYDEAHAQVQSIHEQVFGKQLEVVTPEPAPVPPAAVAQERVAPPTEPTTPPATREVLISDDQHVSTIANRFTEERTKSGELGEIAPGQGYSTRELADAGLKMSPEQINQHVSDLMNGTGDPIEQGKAVRAEEARLSQRSNELSRAASSDPTNVEARLAADNAFKDLTDFHNGPVARAKQIFHGLGMSMQGELPVDLSTFNGLREAFLRDTGKLPSPEVEPQLRAMAEKVSNSVKEDNGAKQSLGQAIEKATARRKLPTYDEVKQNILDRMKTDPCRV